MKYNYTQKTKLNNKKIKKELSRNISTYKCTLNIKRSTLYTQQTHL